MSWTTVIEDNFDDGVFNPQLWGVWSGAAEERYGQLRLIYGVPLTLPTRVYLRPYVEGTIYEVLWWGTVYPTGVTALPTRLTVAGCYDGFTHMWDITLEVRERHPDLRTYALCSNLFPTKEIRLATREIWVRVMRIGTIFDRYYKERREDEWIYIDSLEFFGQPRSTILFETGIGVDQIACIDNFRIGFDPLYFSPDILERGTLGKDILLVAPSVLPGVIVLLGEGIKVNYTHSFTPDRRRCYVNVDVSPTAPLGTRDVVVQNPDTTKYNGFDVIKIVPAGVLYIEDIKRFDIEIEAIPEPYIEDIRTVEVDIREVFIEDSLTTEIEIPEEVEERIISSCGELLIGPPLPPI